MPSEDTNKYAPAVWGQNESINGEIVEDLPLPSGQLCQVRRPGAEGLLRAGVLNDLDTLTKIVDSQHITRVKGGERLNVASLMNDPDAITNMLHVMDRVVCHVVLQPEVHMAPNDVTSREAGVIYTDMIDVEDKAFIMNYALGGSRDVARFRDELQRELRPMDHRESTTRPPKRARRNDK